MSYYHLPTSVERGPGRRELKLSDGLPLSAPDGIWTDTLAALCGFIPVTNTARPNDTPTTTTDRSVTLVNGVPTETWTARPKTQAELDADTHTETRDDLETKARNALTAISASLGQLPAALTTVQTVIDGTAANLSQANTMLDQIANIVKGLLNVQADALRRDAAFIRLFLGGDLLVPNTDT